MEHREVCSAENKALLKGNHALVDAMDMRVIIKLFDQKHAHRKSTRFPVLDRANASAIVMSLIETAKANNLNIYQYLYTLLLYMPDYKNEPAGIKQLMPWSEFIKENCSGITDTEKILPENRGDLPI